MENKALLVKAAMGDFERGIVAEGVPVEPLFSCASCASHGLSRTRPFAASLDAAYPYNPRLRNADAEALIVFGDEGCPRAFLSWLARANPGRRIVVWRERSAVRSAAPAHSVPNMPPACENWSCAPGGSASPGIRENTPFYVEAAYAACVQDAPHRPGFDNVAVVELSAQARQGGAAGRTPFDRERQARLAALESVLLAAGVAVERLIDPGPRRMGCGGPCQRASLSYGAILARKARARVLVDLEADPEAAPSHRILDGVRLGKKIITTNSRVLEAPFYRPENIFVLGNDMHPASVRAFLEAPAVSVPAETLRLYELRAWVDRFFA